MSTRRHFRVFTMLLLVWTTTQGASPRAMLIEARNLAYDANYRNDQAGLRSAIATLQSLTKMPEEGAYANYYLSWAHWALSASQVESNDVKGAVESARQAADHARAALAGRPDDPEFHTALVNALIVIAVLDRSQASDVAPEIARARRRALQLGPTNPRVLLMDAGMIFNAPPEKGGGQEKGLARWQEALRLLEAEAEMKSGDPVVPRWGYTLALGWMPILHLRMTPPQTDNARRAAETALRLRPDFWYVRERVLPRLTK